MTDIPFDNTSVFFILGAGASVDSGLPTYRGKNGLYNDNSVNYEQILSIENFEEDPLSVWNFLDPFYEKIDRCSPGETYTQLHQFIEKYPRSFMMTQNVDGFATDLNIPVIEMHGNSKYMYCRKCDIATKVIENGEFTSKICKTCEASKMCKDNAVMRPNIVLFGESVCRKKYAEVGKLFKYRHPKYVIVIGTTTQFPYIKGFIDKCKSKGAKVIHINPDENYTVKHNEFLLRKTAAEGVRYLIENGFEFTNNTEECLVSKQLENTTFH